MADATEGNPIVFFDVTLGGMPARIFSPDGVTTPHPACLVFLSPLHVVFGVMWPAIPTMDD
jgi:hypothetical protein